MKRLGLILCSVSMILLVTGCGGEKKLECTMELDQNGVKVNQIYTLNFKSNKFTGSVLKQEMKLDENMAPNLATYKSTIENMAKSGQYKNFNSKVTDNGKDTVTLTMDLDVDGFKKMSNSKVDKVSYKDMKKALENANYVCK